MRLDSPDLLQRRSSRSADLHDQSQKAELAYNSSVFFAGLLLLERSAEGFVHHLSSLSSQLGVSPTLIALLTAGAEWEELVVVIASIAHGASNLAIANVVGSAISNILGAFSLGILFAPDNVRFDDSAKRFSIIQAGITALVISLMVLIQLQQSGTGKHGGTKSLFENVVGVSLIVIFVLYFVGLSWAISRGMLTAPADTDSDSDSTASSDDNETLNSDAASTRTIASESEASFVPPRRARVGGRREANQTHTSAARERTPLLLGSATATRLSQRLSRRRRQAAFRAVRKLIVVFAILSLSGYLLSHSILELAKLLRLSDTVLGLTLLSFATTLPEKMLSIVAGRKITSGASKSPSRPSLARRASIHNEAEDDVAQGASSILMAAAAGSNIFLLTLCLGTSLIFDKAAQSVHLITSPLATSVISGGGFSASTVKWQELVLLEVASLSLVLIAYTDGQRWMGALLLAAYVAFLIAEFTWLKR